MQYPHTLSYKQAVCTTAGPQQMAQMLADPFFAEVLFDQLTDVAFFVKDINGYYTIVNRTLMQRCGYHISRDLYIPDKNHPVYQRIAHVVSYVQQHYSEQMKLEGLAQIANLSVTQLERYMQRIFQLTPKQFIMKTRIEAATHLLGQEHTISEVAYACGYADHSAFSRQFKTAVGISPINYRKLLLSQV